MHLIKERLLAVLAIALIAPGAFGQLLPTATNDLSSDRVIAAPQLKSLDSNREVPREPASISWALDANKRLEASPAPFTSRSREYFVEVTAAELKAGVPVYTSAPGALVRLNPTLDDTGFDQKLAIDPSSLILITPAGKAYNEGSGNDQMAGPAELKAAGAPFAEGTSAFRLREDLGAGVFQLKAESLDASERRYVMHVFDRQSPLELRLKTLASDYLHGQTLRVEASLVDASGSKRLVRASKLEGYVTSPASRAWPLTFEAEGDVFRATLVLDALEAPTPGLWQVHASAQARQAGQAIFRAGRTAFACAVPSARLSGEARIAAEGAARRVDLGVEVGSASRYEVRGVLYATAIDGSLQPVGIAHSAAWLDAGAATLGLEFSEEVLNGKALGAPFELRDLRLVNQVDMGLLHRQARALVIQH